MNCHQPIAFRAVISLLILLVFTSGQAEIYKWTDAHGNIHFTDSPPEQVKTQQVKLQINSFTSPRVSSFKYDDSLISKRKESTDVIMYSTSWCGYCKQARRYFSRKRIPFEEYDVEKSSKGKKDYKSLNGRGVPIILVGEKRMNGFSVAQFEKLYSK
jgi:glutaredoxin